MAYSRHDTHRAYALTSMSADTKPRYFGRDLEAMSFAENYHRWIIDEFTPYIGDDVAEVGAGTGNVSALLRPHVKTLTAFEPSRNMFPALTARFVDDPAVTTHNAFFGSLREQHTGRFDTVLYVNVLEHIEDDRGELDIAMETLRPGGYLLIFVPALSFLFSKLDEQVGHFRRYHKRPLAALVTAAGFDLESIRYFDLLGVLPWYVAFTLLGRTVSGANVSAYDRFGVPVTRAVEKLVRPPIGKNLILVARKPTGGAAGR